MAENQFIVLSTEFGVSAVTTARPSSPGDALQRLPCGATDGYRRHTVAFEPISRHRGSERLIQIPRQRRVQLPGDGHRLLPHMAAVGGRAEEPERAIVGAQPGEQHDRPAVAFVVAVAQAGLAVGPGGRLALPVNAPGADRVVAVAGGRREAATALVEPHPTGYCESRMPGRSWASKLA